MLRATLALTASSTLGLLVFTRSAVLLLGYFATTSEVAYYSIAFAMADALQLIVPMSLSFAVIPNIARAFSSGQADFARRIYEGHVRLTALAVLPVAVAGAVLSEAVVHVFYGEAFADAALPLAVLLFAAGVKSIGFCAIWLLVGSDREQLVVWVYGAAAAAKVVVGLACIPSLGVTGALYAEIVSQLVLVAAGALAVRRAVGFGFPAAGVARIAAANLPVLAAAAAAIAVLENDAAAILVGIAAVPPAYALGLWAFRALSPFERSYLRERFAFAQLR